MSSVLQDCDSEQVGELQAEQVRRLVHQLVLCLECPSWNCRGDSVEFKLMTIFIIPNLIQPVKYLVKKIENRPQKQSLNLIKQDPSTISNNSHPNSINYKITFKIGINESSRGAPVSVSNIDLLIY